MICWKRPAGSPTDGFGDKVRQAEQGQNCSLSTATAMAEESCTINTRRHVREQVPQEVSGRGQARRATGQDELAAQHSAQLGARDARDVDAEADADRPDDDEQEPPQTKIIIVMISMKAMSMFMNTVTDRRTERRRAPSVGERDADDLSDYRSTVTMIVVRERTTRRSRSRPSYCSKRAASRPSQRLSMSTDWSKRRTARRAPSGRRRRPR